MVTSLHTMQFITKKCMTRYYTRHRSCLRKKCSEEKISQSELEGIALAETVAYVTESDSDGPFYIVELAELYQTRLRSWVVSFQIGYTPLTSKNVFCHKFLERSKG